MRRRLVIRTRLASAAAKLKANPSTTTRAHPVPRRRAGRFPDRVRPGQRPTLTPVADGRRCQSDFSRGSSKSWVARCCSRARRAPCSTSTTAPILRQQIEQLRGRAGRGGWRRPRRLHYVLGITKAYCTRAGGGPFPTELDIETIGRACRADPRPGREFATTGRPRRCGWIDLAALARSIINGMTGLCITKLDVPDGLEEPVVYRLHARRQAHRPAADGFGGGHALRV